MCARGRIGSQPAPASILRSRTCSRRWTCARLATPAADILCCSQPAGRQHRARSKALNKLGNPQKYAYNDGDGSTAYDVEYPLQIHGFDPNFHFVGMTFNPEGFVDMKDKYFLLNGRSYPDTVTPGPHGHAVVGWQSALLAAAALDHQHSGGREGAAAHLRPGRYGIPDAGLAGDSDEGRRLECQAAAGSGGE